MEAEKRRMKEVLKKKWKNKIKVLTAVCLIALLSLGGTLAYLTDYEAAENKFTVGRMRANGTGSFRTEAMRLRPTPVRQMPARRIRWESGKQRICTRER